MLAVVMTPENINMIIDGVSYAIPRSATQSKEILAELKNANPDTAKLKKLADLVFALELYTGNDCVIKKDGTVIRNGVELPRVLGHKILACFKEGVPYGFLLKLFDKLNANPSKNSVEQLYNFLEHMGMPITPEGNVLGYKGIQEDGYSVRGGDNSKLIQGKANEQGQIYNGVGCTIEVVRNYVEDDPAVGCGAGIHIGSEAYATGWGPRVVIVEFSPADVVSVPHDSSYQKLRVCKYTVVAEYRGRMTDGGVFDPQNPYKDAPASDEEGGYEEAECSCEGCWCEDDGECNETFESDDILEVANALGDVDRIEEDFPKTKGALIAELSELGFSVEEIAEAGDATYEAYCSAYRGA